MSETDVGTVTGNRAALLDAEGRAVEGVRRRRGWLIRRMLLLADVLGLSSAFVVAELIWGYGAGAVPPRQEYLLFITTLPAWIIGAKLYGLYDKDEERTDHSTAEEITTIFHFITVGVWLLVAFVMFMPVVSPDIPKIVTFWMVAVVFVGLGRSGARAVSRRRPEYVQNTVIVGGRHGVGSRIEKKLRQHPEYGIRLLGFITNDRDESDGEGTHVLGTTDELPRLVRQYGIERVIVAFSEDDDRELLELIRELNDANVQVDIVPRFFELISPGVSLHTVEGLPLVGLPPFRLSQSSALLKRTMDLALASIGLILLAPAFALVALAIKLDSRGPVFFRQIRRGASDTLFRLYKFRTMVADADARKNEFAHLNKHVVEGGDPRMFKIENDPRVTRVGGILRKTLLDELPQLINVVKGEMSLVGPRPLILEEDRSVERWARKRLDLRPGMTGLWQVLGRQAISFEEMVKLDYVYVTTWSLGQDLRLLLRTIPLVLRGEGGTY